MSYKPWILDDDLCKKLRNKQTYVHSQLFNKLLKYTMISPEFFEVIRTRLCPELKRYIFQYIDIETRIQMLLEKRPYFATGSTRLPINDINANQKNPLFSLLSGQQLTTIYKEGWLKQLFELKGTNWNPKRELKRVCPSDMIITPLFGNGAINLGVVSEKDYLHSVITTLTQFRRNVKLNNTIFSTGWAMNNAHLIPTAALSLLLNINGLNDDINYYLRKKGFRFLIAMIRFIDKVQYKKELVREQYRISGDRYSMEGEDKRSKAVEKKRAVLEAKLAKAEKKVAVIAAKIAKKQAKQEKAVAIKTKKRATLVSKLNKAIAKKAKRWGVILANQDKAVVQQRRYKLNIIA